MGKTLVDLRKTRTDHADRDDRFRQKNYEQSAPFFDNPRGVLIHRVRSLYQLTATYADEPWTIVEYWCGGHGRSDSSDSGLEFDPGMKLVCQRCEMIAMANGERSSSGLVGRHVCVGVCRPINVCSCPKGEQTDGH